MLHFYQALLALKALSSSSAYFILSQHYDLKLSTRLTQLTNQNAKLCGVYYVERQTPGGVLSFCQNSIPFGQALLIQHSARIEPYVVGLVPNNSTHTFKQLTHHPDILTRSIPVEALPDYETTYGAFPEPDDLDLDLLLELVQPDRFKMKPFYPFISHKHTPMLGTHRNAILNALYGATIRTTKLPNQKNNLVYT